MPRKTPVTTLLILLLQLSQIHHAHSETCPYEISIRGATLKRDESECFEADAPSGIVAAVSATEDPQSVFENLLVWDEDGCGSDDESFVHYSGGASDFTGMTAGAGDPVHTYRAAVFLEGLPLPEGTAGCYAFTTKGDNGRRYECLQTWQVARAGSSCPRTRNSSPAARVGATCACLAASAVLLLRL